MAQYRALWSSIDRSEEDQLADDERLRTCMARVQYPGSAAQ
jgi:hypothetical protein